MVSNVYSPSPFIMISLIVGISSSSCIPNEFEDYDKISKTTGYGHPIKSFFIKNSNFWAWTDTLSKQNTLSAPIEAVLKEGIQGKKPR